DGLLAVEDLERLLRVGPRVLLNVGARELRPGRLFPRGIADHRSKVADDEHDAVARVLEMAHLSEKHGVPQMDIRRRRIEAHVARERTARELAREVIRIDQIDRAARQLLETWGRGSHGG